KNVGTTAGTVAAGNDSRFSTVDGMAGGKISSSVVVNAGYSVGVGPRTQSEDNSAYLLAVSGSSPSGQYVNFIHYSWYAGFVRTGIRRGGSQDVNRYSISMAVNDTGGTTREWAFNADGTANGSGAWTTGSDERHKFDLAEVSGALEKIAALRCVTYSKWDSEVRHVGLIAQDVGAICPEAISISTEPVRFSGNREIDDFQFLDISGFTAAYAFQAIKELHEMVNKQAAEIEAIKGLINSH
ncbi:tail fiber domain-containing protein, partial [Enterobacter cloacae]